MENGIKSVRACVCLGSKGARTPDQSLAAAPASSFPLMQTPQGSGDGSRSWVVATTGETWLEFPGSAPALAIARIWDVNQQMGALSVAL